MRSYFVTLTLFTALCSSNHTIAATTTDQPPQIKASTLDDIVVTATRFPEKRATIPANTSVITSEEIRASTATSVPDLLRGQVGVTVSDYSGTGRGFTIDLGGFGDTASSNTLVLVDGRRVNQADSGGSDWLQIPLERVEKIEIIRGGGASVLYGDNATGGVINIITRSGGNSQGDAKVAAGSYGTTSTHLGFSGSQESLSYAVNTGYRKADGYRDNSATEAKDAGVKITYDINSALAANFSAGYQKDHAGMPGPLGESDFANGFSRQAIRNSEKFNFMDTEDYFLHGGPEWHLGADHLAKIDISFRRRDASGYLSGLYTSTLDTWSVSPRMQLNQKMGEFIDKVTLGWDYQADTNEANSGFGSNKRDKKNQAYYIHNELQTPYHWRLTTGYRLDKTNLQFKSGKPDQITLDEEAFSLGTSYALDKTANLYLNYAKSFRYPSLDERFDSGLVPQHTDELQLGLNHTLAFDLKSDIHLFQSMTNRELFYDSTTYKNVNLDGKTRRRGLRLAMEQQLEQWYWRGHYARTAVTIQDGPYKGYTFPGVPQYQAGMTVRYAPTKAWTLTWDGKLIGPKVFSSDFSNTFGEQASYVLMDASLQYHWPRLTGYLTIRNLIDKEYAEYGVIGFNATTFAPERAYYPSPGRQFMAGVTAHF